MLVSTTIIATDPVVFGFFWKANLIRIQQVGFIVVVKLQGQRGGRVLEWETVLEE
jgi:hypothetical protein